MFKANNKDTRTTKPTDTCYQEMRSQNLENLRNDYKELTSCQCLNPKLKSGKQMSAPPADYAKRIYNQLVLFEWAIVTPEHLIIISNF